MTTVARPGTPSAARMAGRLPRVGVVAVVVLGWLLAGPASPGYALDRPTTITVAGPGLPLPLSVHADTQADLFTTLLKQLTWMVDAPGTPMRVDQATLGPRFTVTVLAGDTATQLVELYPLAAGGPRAHRPAGQPQHTATEAWFYASVAIPDVLRAAGVPLVAPGSSAGRYANPGGDQMTRVAASTDLNLPRLLAQARDALLSSVAAAVLVLLLLFAAARRSRRRFSRR